MKRILLLTILLLGGVSFNNVFSQSSDMMMKKKEKSKAEFEKQYKATKQILENKDFVLESDYLQDQYGNRVLVSPTVNFIMVNGDTAVIQIGSNVGVGPNTVGGVTAKGKITKWKLRENGKGKAFSIQMSVTTGIGIYDLNFVISGSGDAQALLTGLSKGRLTFDGDIVPIEESSVFEGLSI